MSGGIITRKELEEIEDKVLAPYATKSRETRGREHEEAEHPYRSVYQRDRDRIIHSTAFRRLEYKTQVFVNHEGDYYRTRLTHTNEVAQIARTIAKSLRLNEELTESIALGHDIGHTPFGHSGEKVMDTLMADEGGFEHNRQSLRTLVKLEQKYPDFPGLNLSWETREGIIKHTTAYDNAKSGEYEPSLSPSLEAQAVNLADEIAYNSHDLDDGITSGIIKIEDLKDTIIWNEIINKMDMKKYEDLPIDMKKYNITRALINIQITKLLENTLKNINENNIRTIDDVRAYKGLIVKYDDEGNSIHHDLKGFLYKNFYKHHRVIRMEYKAEKIITGLFNIYLEKGSVKDHRYENFRTSILPPEASARLDKGDSLKRVICDYIAGMTDRFILDEYKKLFDPYEKV